MKASFDFDATLDRKAVQDYARELMARGVEVWICTARLSPEESQQRWNDDLFEVADDLGISRDHIIFTPHADKWISLKGKGFLFHLDDDWTELNTINKHTKCVGVSSFGSPKWREKCEQALK